MNIHPEKIWARSLTALAVGVATIALAGCSLLPGGGDGGETDAFSIKVGDCINDAALGETVTTIPVVDCSEPHDSEAYHSFLLPDGDIPAQDELFAQADQGCLDAFEGYVGAEYGEETSVYEVSYLYPTTESWAQGDREILCVLYDRSGQSTGSAKDSGK